MTRRLRSCGVEEDIWSSVAADADGWVTRQMELQGPLDIPIAAASLVEWEAARPAGTVADCEATFGATAEVCVRAWDAHDPPGLTGGEFETVWRTARAACRARARARSARGA